MRLPAPSVHVRRTAEPQQTDCRITRRSTTSTPTSMARLPKPKSRPNWTAGLWCSSTRGSQPRLPTRTQGTSSSCADTREEASTSSTTPMGTSPAAPMTIVVPPLASPVFTVAKRSCTPGTSSGPVGLVGTVPSGTWPSMVPSTCPISTNPALGTAFFPSRVARPAPPTWRSVL
jgi:hypothetical protein